MPTSYVLWNCDKCKTTFPTKELAEECESSHIESLEVMYLGHYGGPWPETILIENGANRGQFAEYELRREDVYPGDDGYQKKGET